MLVEQWHSHWVKVQMEQAFRAQLMALNCAWLGMRLHVMLWKYGCTAASELWG